MPLNTSLSPTHILRRLASLAHGSAGLDPSQMPSEDERYNARLYNLEAPFTSLTMSFQGFFAVFAIKMGASNALVGWLTSGPALINLFWLIPCGRIIQSSRNTARPYALGTLLHRLVVISFVLVPFLPQGAQPVAFAALVTLASLPNALRGIAFQAAAGEMFSSRHFSRYIGQRWAVMSIAEVLYVLGLGALLDLIPFPLSFQAISIGVAVLTLATIWFVLRLRLPQRPPRRPVAGAGRLDGALLRQAWGRYRAFVLFEIGVLISYLSIYFAYPLFRIYWIRHLEASGTWVGILLASVSIGLMVGCLLFGEWSRPDRDRKIMFISTLGFATAFPMLTALFGSLPPLFLVGLLGGFFAGGCELTIFNRMVQLAPAEERPNYIAVHNLVLYGSAFVGPLLGTGLADLIDIRLVLMIAGGLGIAGAYLLRSLAWEKAPLEGHHPSSPAEPA